ncbi:NAD(P)H-hydrate dehydratase [Oenococcus sicerae]|uniref:NAD(P)H-hydrate dehydratase n=1 Tax=Oenococcus sicerae TaxID=2203724 RepID=UPI0039ED38E5
MDKKVIEKKSLSKVIQRRLKESNKTNYGRILLICGSRSFGGAAIMATKAAVYSGAGLVTLASDSANRTALLSTVPEAMFIDYSNKEKLLSAIKKSNVILIGSGLEDSDFSLALLKNVFNSIQQKQILIIDGTALSMIGKYHLSIPKNPTTVLTPHQGEWQRISGLSISEQNPAQNYKKMSALQNDFLVLKSSATEIYSITNTKEYGQLNIGGPYQATGGMGDTLAGLISGFMGQFHDNNLLTIQAAVYLHSYIANLLSQNNYVTLPTKIADQIPLIMKTFIQNEFD